MIVQYAGIDLDIEHITLFEQRACFSDDGGRDYLWTHIHLGVVFVWNPKATATPKGDMPAISIAQLRHQLMQPRQLLQIQFGGNQLLQAPMLDPTGKRFPCDANNGPSPINVSVQEFHGTKSAIGYFEIECWVNELPIKVSPILSHRWQMTHDMDENAYTTRTITGRAIFRADVMQSLSALPDDFRSTIFHPCPPTFQRTQVHVAASSDGMAIDYTIVDEEQTLVMTGALNGNSQTAGQSGGNTTSDTGGRVTKIKGFVTHGWANNSDLMSWSGNLLHPTGGFGIHPAGLFSTRYANFIVQAWGNRLCLRSQLINACLIAAAAYRFNKTFQNPNVSPRATKFHACSITVDIVNKYVELNASCNLAGLASGILGNIGADPIALQNFMFGPQLNAGAGQSNNFPPENIIGRVQLPFTSAPQTIRLMVADPWDVPAPGFNAPNDSQTRGTYIARVFAQQLLNTVRPVPSPASGQTDPPTVTIRTYS